MNYSLAISRFFAASGVFVAAARTSVDTYFVRREHLFRGLYEAARLGEVEPFSMDVHPFHPNVRNVLIIGPTAQPIVTLFLALAGVIIFAGVVA